MNWKLRGGHKQEVREGYNLIKVEKETTTINGITFTINKDGSISCNGTATASTTLYFASANNSIYPKEIDAGKYKIVGGTTNVMLGCQVGSTYYNTNSNRIVELSEQSSISNAYVQIASGTTVNNETIYPLLYKYNNVEKTYEQYGASPSPDHLSEVEAVGDNINLINKENVTKLYFNQTQINIGATSKTIVEKCSPKTTYTISKMKSTKFRVCTTNTEPKENAIMADYVYNDTGDKITITTSDNANYMCIYFYDSNSDTLTEQEILNSLKLEKGSVATPYSSYNQGSIKIDVENNNIMPLNLETNWELTSNGIKNLARNNGAELTKIKVKSGQNIKLGIQFLSNLSTESTFSAYIDNQESKDLSIVGFQSYKLNKIYQKNYIATKDCEIKIRLWGNANSETFEFQLWAEIDNLTEYKTHQDKTVIMPVQQELLENDYIADVEHHEWKKLILDGNEEIIKDSRLSNDNRSVFFIKTNDIYSYTNASSIPDILSNQFKAVSQSSTWKNGDISRNSEYPDYIAVVMETGYTLESFKEWLSTNNPIVYYKLATPINLELTEEQKAIREQKLNTYKNITNINLSDELASIDVEYKKDIETEFDKKQDKLTAGTGITIEDNVISTITTAEVGEAGVELASTYLDDKLTISLLDEGGTQLSKIEQTIPSCKETHYAWDKSTGDTAKALFQQVYNNYKNGKLLNVDLKDGNKLYKLTNISQPNSMGAEYWCQFRTIDWYTNGTDMVFLQTVNAVLNVAGDIVQSIDVKESINQFALVREYDGTNGALPTNNTKTYVPQGNYEPATKLYVDKTHYMYFPGYSSSKTQTLKNVNGTLQWVDE